MKKFRLTQTFCILTVVGTLLVLANCSDKNDPNNKPPGIPTLLMPVNNSANIPGNTQLNWSPSTGAKNYNLQISTTSDFSTLVIDASNITGENYSPNGLLPSTKYYWRADAVNSFGGSLWSDIWNFTTSISIPIPISPLNNSISIPNNTTVSWSSMADATMYNLQVSLISDFSTKLIDLNNITQPNYILTGLTSSSKYYWRVSVSNNLGTSQWSDTGNFTTNLVPVTDLVAYYPFNGNANDNSGNGYNGTVHGSTLTTDRKGNIDKAYSFNGIDNYISVQHASALNLIGNFTISSWYNSDGCTTPCPDPAYHTIIMKRDVSITPTDDWPWGLSISYIDGGSGTEFKKLFATRRSTGTVDYKSSTNQVELNTWQHVVIVVENDVQSIYINGILDSSSQFTLPQLSSTKNMNIGWSLRSGLEQFKGKIDDIRMYSRALSSQEVQALYFE